MCGRIGISVNKPCCVVANVAYVENGCAEQDAQKIGVRSSNEQLRVIAYTMCIVSLLCKLPSHVESVVDCEIYFSIFFSYLLLF